MFDRAYLEQLNLLDIYRIEPAEPQRRAAEDLLRRLLAEEFQAGWDARDWETDE